MSATTAPRSTRAYLRAVAAMLAIQIALDLGARSGWTTVR
jgi:hypothetical protein